MIRNPKLESKQGLGWSIMILLFSLFIMFFMYLMLNPLFVELGNLTVESANSTYFENDTDQFMSVLNVIAVPGILVVVVFSFSMTLLAYAIRLTNT